MTSRMPRVLGCVVIGWAAMGAGAARAQEDLADDDVVYVEAGRVIEDGRHHRLRGEAGFIFSMEGFVQETTRALYDVTGSTYKQADAERYDLNDFDMGGGDLLIGASYERQWKYFTFNSKVLLASPETDGVASRNYYLDVGDTSFNGVDYDNIKIPKGTAFSAEMTVAFIELDALATPATFWINNSARCTPLLGFSFFGLVGTYEIEAGPATGVTQYQNPPEDFVVGGKADGTLAGGLPEFSSGAELVIGEEAGTQFTLTLLYGFLAYEGSTEYFTSNDSRHKDADIEHWRLRVRAAMDVPLESGHTIFFGAEFEQIDTWAYLEQTGDTPEEIVARQERFDKEVDFTMSYGTVFCGVTL